MPRKTKHDVWVAKARATHGNRYIYPEKRASDAAKSVITCRLHGDFEQRPGHHIRLAHGCPLCRTKPTPTFERFVDDARNVHGDQFIYDKTNWKYPLPKVSITCRQHGVFKVGIYSHLLREHGCPRCSSGMSTAAFINKARRIHGRVYDYRQTVFRGASSKIKGVCSLHGVFNVAAKEHLNGVGCPQCGTINALRTRGLSAFLLRARSVYGEKYDYTNVLYVNSNEYIDITCPEHGPFKCAPKNHVTGKQECPDCTIERYRRERFQIFLMEAQEKFGDRYEYVADTYVTKSEPMTMICKIHGSFKKVPETHLRYESGCEACAGRRVMVRDTHAFIEEARRVHGDVYGYDNCEYRGYNIKLEVECRTHGAFMVMPSTHLLGSQCAACSFDLRREGAFHLNNDKAEAVKEVSAKIAGVSPRLRSIFKCHS